MPWTTSADRVRAMLAYVPPTTRTPYPAPKRSSRDAEPFEMPSAIGKLAQFAREASWEVRAQSSMGQIPHGSTGRPGAVKRLIAVTFGAHPMTDRRAYVVYETPEASTAWKPRSVMIWGPDLPPYAHCSMIDLRAYLGAPDIEPEALKAWVAGLEKARQESEAFRKRRLTVRRQILKVAEDGRFAAAREETRQGFSLADAQWRARVADLQDGVFTSEEVAGMIEASARRVGRVAN